ncbi:MAG: dienelactone hydrolase family protein [Calditrichota bacterium]
MTLLYNRADGPHNNQPLINKGAPLDQADRAIILTHGRGADAQDILTLADELQIDRSTTAVLAPDAKNHTWYPLSFMAPIEQNEPFLTSALNFLGDTLKRLEENDISSEKVMMIGFSQGACLSTEFVARNPKRYWGVAALSGGLIGPPNRDFQFEGDLNGTPIFLGCSDVDFHIPKERVQQSTIILNGMGAETTEHLYPGMGHTINTDELRFVQDMIDAV